MGENKAIFYFIKPEIIYLETIKSKTVELGKWLEILFGKVCKQEKSELKSDYRNE